MKSSSLIARRPLLSGLMGVLGLGTVAGLVYEGPRLAFRRYARTPYDDLLGQLGDDRDGAIRLGRAVLAIRPELRAERAAAALRRGPGRTSLAEAVEVDLAEGRLQAIQGWLLPETIVLVSAVAAGTSPAG